MKFAFISILLLPLSHIALCTSKLKSVQNWSLPKRTCIEHNNSNTPRFNTIGLYNRLTYNWIRKLIDIGQEKTIEVDDIWSIENDNINKNVSHLFDSKLKYELSIESSSTNKRNSFGPVLRTIIAMYEFIFYFLYFIILFVWKQILS